jgi:apolipoprotein N-acyltransferase
LQSPAPRSAFDRVAPYVTLVTAIVVLLTYLDVLWLIGIPAFVGPPSPWEDVALLGLLIVTTGANRRSASLILVAILFWAGRASTHVPSYLVCFVPLVWLWHYSKPSRMWMWEALAVAFVMGWLVAPFMRASLPHYAVVAQVCVCVLWAIPVIGFAACFRIFRGRSALFAAIPAALTATLCELLQTAYGFGGSCPALSLPAAPTPLAQWAYYVGPVGVSFLIYLLNCLWLPDIRLSRPWRYLPPAVASILATLAWLGGYQIAKQVGVPPLSFTALIVQPFPDSFDGVEKMQNPLPRWRVLDRLTNAALAEAGVVDLIVWPESSLEPGVWTEKLVRAPSEESRQYPAWLGAMPLTDFYQYVMPRYLTACLVGNKTRTGVGEFYNGACLIEPDGSVSRHDKVALTPLLETLPEWLPADWVRARVLPAVGVDAPFQAGRNFHLLSFKGRDGHQISLALSICYEMYFPWLPQFHLGKKPDAIIHLTSEDWCKDFPSYWRFETWACQYRAIETRNWQLICTTRGNSAVIDPRGVIACSLRGKAGVIHTGTLFQDTSAGKPGAGEESR